MHEFRIKPENTEFVILSFEGPDDYSLAGGLGTRVRGLSKNLAKLGYITHLFFIGDPRYSGFEQKMEGKLNIYRWCQWISNFHPNGVYDGEENKLRDFNDSIPYYVTENIVQPAVKNRKLVVIMAEEWHTAQTVINLSDYLHFKGIRDRVIMLWNANNVYSFHKINWGALNYISQITTVSKYMKHEMWKYAINPIVIPNGIPENFFRKHSYSSRRNELHEKTGADIILLKVGRFSPDKRWHMAIRALPILKSKGLKSFLIMKGGNEPFGGEVFHEINQLGLKVRNINLDENTIDNLQQKILEGEPADIYNVLQFMPENMLKPLYAECDAVLANSGHEPFGLVGLEVMACGGIPYLGSTGEDYAIPFKNSVVLETDDPNEIVSYIEFLYRRPLRNREIRKMAKSTARMYTWKNVIQSNLLARLLQIKESTGVRHD